jgi:Nucleotide-diphospho-sugar transferase
MQITTTIVTKSHISWALALNESLLRFQKNLEFCVLVTDVDEIDFSFQKDFPNTKFLFLKDLQSSLGKEIIYKYSETPDYMRWSLKPVLINHLIDKGYEKVMFCDCDIYFYSSFDFLWQELENSSVLITPHWFNTKVSKNIHTLHTTGICNGGFVAVSKKGYAAMEWWAKMCLDKCNSKYGTINVDQGYLELLPFFFDNVQILKHKGCNVSYWTDETLGRETDANKFYLVDKEQKFPLVFYHFASNRYSQFFKQDKPFFEALNILNASLKKFGNNSDVVKIGQSQSEGNYKKLSFLGKIKATFPYRIYRIF